MSKQMEKHNKFQKKSIYHSPTHSVSMLMSNFIFQTAITRGWRLACRDTFVFYATYLGETVWNKKILIIPDPKDTKRPITSKGNNAM